MLGNLFSCIKYISGINSYILLWYANNWFGWLKVEENLGIMLFGYGTIVIHNKYWCLLLQEPNELWAGSSCLEKFVFLYKIYLTFMINHCYNDISSWLYVCNIDDMLAMEDGISWKIALEGIWTQWWRHRMKKVQWTCCSWSS